MMFLRTIILNFFIGPLIVVGSVILHRNMDRTGRAWRISHMAILIGAQPD